MDPESCGLSTPLREPRSTGAQPAPQGGFARFTGLQLWSRTGPSSERTGPPPGGPAGICCSSWLVHSWRAWRSPAGSARCLLRAEVTQGRDGSGPPLCCTSEPAQGFLGRRFPGRSSGDSARWGQRGQREEGSLRSCGERLSAFMHRGPCGPCLVLLGIYLFLAAHRSECCWCSVGRAGARPVH